MNVGHATNQPKVLFVDDELAVLKSLNRLGQSQDWDVTVALSAKEALELIDKSEFDVIISDMRMPEMSGAEFLTKVKDVSPESIRVLLTGYSDLEALESAINDAKIHNYISKPWDDSALTEAVDDGIRFINTQKERKRIEKLTEKQNKKLGRLALILDKQVKERTIEIEQALSLLHRSNESVESHFFESLTVLAHILEWKEGRDSGHSRFVAQYGEKLASILKLSDKQIQNVRVAAMLHRVGVLGLPDDLRMKPVFLFNAEEKKLLKKLPLWGEAALSNAPSMEPISKIIRHQYEWVNGQGYPDKLTDKDIPIESKIIALVADFYDVFNGRLIRSCRGFNGAKEYIEEWKGRKYDANITQQFWQALEDFSDNAIDSFPVFSAELETGMILDSDIATKKGILLITNGTHLTTSVIEQIKAHEKRYAEEFVIRIRAKSLN